MERNPWWQALSGPFPVWKGPKGVKPDGGGNVRGQGRVGRMLLHRAVFNRDRDAIVRLVDEGEDVNEVEGAGCTPLHNAAFDGWAEGCELLLGLGAKVNASNNAGDTAWHFATNMGHAEVAELLVKYGANKSKGDVLVQEHVPKVKDFFSKPCWAHHPKPYADFVEFKRKEHEALEAERKRAVRV
ncbi:hypothetical protein Rsub_04004 [Raphidocelis subcapitata]|uniref:Uncharacterized protein n=1 Tax=Raphidocelis subcapitata TaxID=307507 RepID=A0A2V0P1I7_9CHLO|nr:hypothetical protein Rsub_04004 [Raphidocelis subcapitata]|eukprot:GBF91700.1 hypothetical protein Rsub_04004 [Raphidocelis subcapitata]